MSIPTLALFALFALVLAPGCGREEPGGLEGAETLVHLADALEHASARTTGSPASSAPRAWSFAEPRPEWRALDPARSPQLAPLALEPIAGATKVALLASESARGLLVGGLAVDLPKGPLDAWTSVVVRARSHSRMAGMGASYGVDEASALPNGFRFFMASEGTAPVFNDGSLQTYQLPLIPREHGAKLESLGLFFAAPQPAELELVAVELVPRGGEFAEDAGVLALVRGGTTRRTLYAHAPAALSWKLRVPEGGRLDVGLACLPGLPVRYRATLQSGSPEIAEVPLAESTDGGAWVQRSCDLSKWAGREVELTLHANSDQPGAVALWGAPIVSGSARSKRPNVVLYVIDGAGADLMSVYGYERKTTPFLERLAKEGVVFERAHSNSTWTQSSTASFMTGLQHSVLGGLRRGVHSTPVPAGATTMAERMRRGGYATAVLTSNPNAARVIGLERGVDYLRDSETGEHSRSSTELHEAFWRFRRDYPGRPWWVHFQTTDVHEPNEPHEPFAGLFVSPERRKELEQWHRKMWSSTSVKFGTTSIAAFHDAVLAEAGLDRHAYYDTRRGLYDETMAHQDRELERFVEQLKAEGEWEDTLLVITADHGHPAGTFTRFGRGLIEPQPEPWQGALFDSYSTRVPLIFVWPGKLAAGLRIAQPVSLVDLLPTILELVDLPAQEPSQGRSLAQAVFGKELEPRVVVLDEFRVDEASGEMVGNLELIDGRWGASLEIGPLPGGAEATRGRHAVPAGGRWGAVHPWFPDVPRLLLYDLEKDPFAARAVNDEHPELVERYRAQLTELWRAQQALATHFGEAADTPLTPDVLRDLRALGYVK
jgi:arylsulfatase A-like enzyme